MRKILNLDHFHKIFFIKAYNIYQDDTNSMEEEKNEDKKK